MEVLRGVPQQQQGRIPHKEQTLSLFVFVEETPKLGGGSLGFPLKVLNKRQNPCGISQALCRLQMSEVKLKKPLFLIQPLTTTPTRISCTCYKRYFMDSANTLRGCYNIDFAQMKFDGDYPSSIRAIAHVCALSETPGTS